MSNSISMQPHEQQPGSISVLTLNCWGLLLVSKHRRARVQEIGRFLAQARHLDVVCLQEVRLPKW